MLKARMTISDAYNISSNSVSLLPIHDYFCSNANNLSMGKGISNLLFEMKNLVPNYMISLVQAGEKSGSLDLALTRIADIADIEIDTKLKRLTALVEPMLMIAMGIIVGTIALSIMLPIYDISKTLQR
jgi:type IV pilus assembly protein PilC